MVPSSRSSVSPPGSGGASRTPRGAVRRPAAGRAGALAVLGVGFAVALAGCGSTGGAAPGGEAGGGGTGIDGKRITLISFGQQYEFIVGLNTTIQEDLEEAGVDLTVVDGRSDPNLQTTQVQDALAQQPDALIVDPVDPDLMTTAIQGANQQGVPVFITESLPDGVEYAGFVGYDNVAAGTLGAQTLAGLVGDQGTVLQLRGGEGSKQARERQQGFDEEMAANHPGVTVTSLNTEWTAENANAMVLDAFTADSGVAGIWSHNDEMIRGSEQALTQLGRTAPAGSEGHISVVGHDGTPLALERIRGGSQDASVVYDAIEMGTITAENIVAHFEGEEFTKDTIIEPFLADSSNVDDPELWGNLPALND